MATISGTNINYFHKDHLGSSTVISDNNGNAIETSDYLPFGSPPDHSGSTASNYKFTDQEFDPASGLYNYNARLYDPVIGRFISPDPFVQAAFDPQTLNRYSYVRNNPLIYIDPSGYGFFSKVFKKAKNIANTAVKRLLPAAVGVTVGLITGQPILGAMAAGAASGGMDGGTDGAALGAIFGLFTGGLSAGSMSGDSTFLTSFKRLLSSGLQAVHAHASSAMDNGGGGGGPPSLVPVTKSINTRLLISSSIGLGANALGILAGTLAMGAPTGVTQILGGVVLTKSFIGLGLNASNILNSFRGGSANPSSAFGLIAEGIAPGNLTAQRLATVADLTIDLGFIRSARLGIAAAEKIALRTSLKSQPYAIQQVKYMNPTELGKVSNLFGYSAVTDSLVGSLGY